jgi:hypothetical protein
MGGERAGERGRREELGSMTSGGGRGIVRLIF